MLALAELVVLIAIGGSGASALLQGFQETTLPFATLVNPTAIRFAADRRVRQTTPHQCVQSPKTRNSSWLPGANLAIG